MTKTVLAISVIALVAIIMVMGTVLPAMADHDKGEGKSNDDEREDKACKNGSEGNEGWNCAAKTPRKRGQS